MQSAFSALDWLVFGSYFLLLALSSFILGKTKISSSREFFLSPTAVPMYAVALSVLATSQSAATFLGVPELSYGGDFTFIGFYFSALLAVIFVAYVLIPKYYEMRAVTVYELLESRYGKSAKQQAGIMFLIGRVLASGARLYIGALAISMILFSDIIFVHVAISIIILMVGALSYTYFGGVRSVILSDVIQAVVYISAGVAVVIYLYLSLYDIFCNTSIMRLVARYAGLGLGTYTHQVGNLHAYAKNYKAITEALGPRTQHAAFCMSRASTHEAWGYMTSQAVAFSADVAGAIARERQARLNRQEPNEGFVPLLMDAVMLCTSKWMPVPSTAIVSTALRTAYDNTR